MNQLQIIEHQNQRVLTTKQLSDVYETSVENINKNFQRNREIWWETWLSHRQRWGTKATQEQPDY